MYAEPTSTMAVAATVATTQRLPGGSHRRRFGAMADARMTREWVARLADSKNRGSHPRSLNAWVPVERPDGTWQLEFRQRSDLPQFWRFVQSLPGITFMYLLGFVLAGVLAFAGPLFGASLVAKLIAWFLIALVGGVALADDADGPLAAGLGAMWMAFLVSGLAVILVQGYQSF